MSENNACPYCKSNQNFPYGRYICDLQMSKVYLFHEQSKYGRCILACKHHVSDITQLSEEERSQYFSDLNTLCIAMNQCFHPGKINFGSYYDTGRHLHIHVVPKYADGDEWGTTFTMNPEKIFLSDMDADSMADNLLNAFNRLTVQKN